VIWRERDPRPVAFGDDLGVDEAEELFEEFDELTASLWADGVLFERDDNWLEPNEEALGIVRDDVEFRDIFDVCPELFWEEEFELENRALDMEDEICAYVDFEGGIGFVGIVGIGIITDGSVATPVDDEVDDGEEAGDGRPDVSIFLTSSSNKSNKLLLAVESRMSLSNPSSSWKSVRLLTGETIQLLNDAASFNAALQSIRSKSFKWLSSSNSLNPSRVSIFRGFDYLACGFVKSIDGYLKLAMIRLVDIQEEEMCVWLTVDKEVLLLEL